MLSEVFRLLFPLPIRWLWFVLYGLIAFRASTVILLTYFQIDLVSQLRESDLQSDSEFNLRRIDELVMYLTLIYFGLAITVSIIPNFLVPVVVTGVVLSAMIIPLNKFSLSYRYAFIGYMNEWKSYTLSSSCLRRVVLNGWRTPTKYSELVLADILTSFSKILADWDALFWCYLVTPFYNPDSKESSSPCTPSLLSVILVWYPYFSYRYLTR